MLITRWCVLCGEATAAVPCVACARRVARARPAGPEARAGAPVVACAAAFAYEGVVRDLLTALKYRNRREPVAHLAAALAPHAARLAADLQARVGRAAVPVDPRPVGPGSPVVLTWAPTSPRRRRRRGFDQAELLARAVGHHAGLAVLPLLRRVPGPAQTGRDALERHLGPAFVPRRAAPALVVVVDDVATTGATLTAAGRALAAAGALGVAGLVVAWTPPARAR